MLSRSFLYSTLLAGALASPQRGGHGGGGPGGHQGPGGHNPPWEKPNAPLPTGLPHPTGAPGGGGGDSGGTIPGPSPEYDWVFEYPLPIPPVAEAKTTVNIDGQSIKYYELTIESFEQQVYPNLGPAHKVGYNGMSPGPTFQNMRGEETVIRALNKGSGAAVVHLHGSPSHSPWDGWASDLVQPGQFKDYYYPNSQAGPLWYHDHVDHNSAPDVFNGQAGVYIIYDPAEDALGLPSGDYDIPLTITDKSYTEDGDLVSVEGVSDNFLGDIIQVNEQPWPYMNVEPRKYRLRIFDMSLSRAYELIFVDEETGNLIDVQVIASDGGLFRNPVTTGSIAISMAERYEVVMDFAQWKGKNITLGNSFENQQGVPVFPNTDKIMRFVVGDTVNSNDNNGDVPDTLNANIPFPDNSVTEVSHTFNFQHGGDAIWTINGVDFDDINNRILARPPQGTVEMWDMVHASGPGAVHPAHIHLVNFQILERTGGARPALPYETAGLKDVVFLAPGESVRTLAWYGPWNGLYMFHCHNLIHEDYLMMAAMNVTALPELGYDLKSTQDFVEPTDPRFKPRDYSDELYEDSAIHSTLSYLGNLGAYKSAGAVQAAESKYYAKNGYPEETGGESGGPAPTASGSAKPASSGKGSAPATTESGSKPTESGAPKESEKAKSSAHEEHGSSAPGRHKSSAAPTSSKAEPSPSSYDRRRHAQPTQRWVA